MFFEFDRFFWRGKHFVFSRGRCPILFSMKMKLLSCTGITWFVLSFFAVSLSTFANEEHTPTFFDYFGDLISSFIWANEGHQLGGDLFGGDNTLETFGKLLENRRNSKNFKYAEYDIRETSDGVLVSFYNNTLQGEKIEELSLNEIRKLNPNIPTVEEIYAFSVENKLPKNKPLVGDIKHLKTDKARSFLLEIAESHKEEIETWFIGKPKNIRASFGDFHRWAVMFSRARIPMYEAYKPKNMLNNQFSYMHDVELNFEYKTLVEKSVLFSKEENRVQVFYVMIPEDAVHTCLRLGVKHGYDDKGDRRSRMRVVSKDNEKVLCDVRPAQKGWQWVILSDLPKEGVKVEWSDSDTPLDGENPGNATLVNVSLGLWAPVE